MAFLLASDGLTIYTGGNAAHTERDVQRAIETAVSRGARLDLRQIKAFSQNPDGSGVRIHFHEGYDHHVRMVMSSPRNVPRAASLINSLGLETRSHGYIIAKSAMVATSLHGCFVPGDTSTGPKTVHAVQYSGTPKAA